MDMKGHVLAALTEQLGRWEELLDGMSEEQVLTPLEPSAWSIKDVMVHLWAWQQRSLARMQAAALAREPEYPLWPTDLDPAKEDDTSKINAWIFENNRAERWTHVYRRWREGFRRFLLAADALSERELLDSSSYPWAQGYPLASTLLASYDHHQEHLEKMLDWLATRKRAEGEAEVEADAKSNNGK